MNEKPQTRDGDCGEALVAPGKDGVWGHHGSQPETDGDLVGASDRLQTRLHRRIRFVVKGLPPFAFVNSCSGVSV